MEPTSYAEVVTRNIRAARSRQDLDQANIVKRMRALGYENWHRQTMGKVERGERRVTADEVLALSLALETSISSLVAAKDEDEAVEFPSGAQISVLYVRMSAVGRLIHGTVQWEGDVPVILEPDYAPAVVDAMNQMATGTWPPTTAAED